MPQTQTVRFKDYRWGLADSPYFASDWQFVDSRNILIREKAPIIKPAFAQSSGFTTSTHEMLCAVDNYFFGEWGKVYINTANNDTPTRTITGGADIYSAIRFDNKIVFLHEWGSVKLGYYDWSRTDEWSLTGDTIQLNSNNEYPMVVFAGKLWVGSGSKLYSVTTAGVRTEELTTLRGDIVWLTVSGQMIKIFLGDWLVCFWDWTEGTTYNESLDLKMPIRIVFSTGSEDFLACGWETVGADTKVVRMVGYQYEVIATYQNKGVQIYSENEGNTWQMAFNNWIVFMPWVVEPDSGSAYCWVYTYWSIAPIFPKSWNLQYSTSAGGYDYSNLSCIHYYDGKLYVCYTDSNGTIWVDEYTQDPDAPLSEYTNWYFIPPIFDWGNRNRLKKITRVRYHGSTESDVVIKYNTDKFYKGTADRRKLLKDWLSDFTTLVTFDNTDSAEQNSKYGKAVDIIGYAFLFKVELGANSTFSELEVDFIYLD